MKNTIIKLVIAINISIIASLTCLALPDYLDWRNKDETNWMTSVKYQGYCGSCWAFATVGAVEAQYNIVFDNAIINLNLSEENLVSDTCSNCGDCDGGWNYRALSFIKDTGITNENCFPYVDQNCQESVCGCTYGCSDATSSDRCSDWQGRLWGIDDYKPLSKSKETLKKYLYEVGPIVTSLRYANYTWDNGIFSCSIDKPANHAVVIVGYNETGDYWIVRNSWGPDWPPPSGDGYFYVGFGECDIQSNAYGITISVSDWPTFHHDNLRTGFTFRKTNLVEHLSTSQ